MAWVLEKDKRKALLREQSAKAGRSANCKIWAACKVARALSKSRGAAARADSLPGPSVVQLPEQVLVAAIPVCPAMPTSSIPTPSPIAPQPPADSTPPWRRSRSPHPPTPPPPPATGAYFQDALLTDSTTRRPPSRRVTIDSWCESRGCGLKRESLQCLFCAVHCAWTAGCSWPGNISGLCTVHWNKPYRCQHADYWCHHSSKQKDNTSC